MQYLRIIRMIGVLLVVAVPPSPAVGAGSEASQQGRKLDGGLLHMLASAEPEVVARQAGYLVRDGRVRVAILVRDGAAAGTLGEWLVAHGAVGVSCSRSLVEAEVGLVTLAALEDRPEVVWVRRPHHAELPGEAPVAGTSGPSTKVVSEGLVAMNGPAWHAAGYTGQGVKVGVIDIGFNEYSELLGDELPPSDRVHFRPFPGSAVEASMVHGTACAEVIYDMAPDAELYLARVYSDPDFLQALDWLQEEGVGVISMSLGWGFVGPGDGTGWIQQRIDRQVLEDDIVWALAAGNLRDEHWQGWTDDRDGDGWVELADGKEILMLVNDDGTPEPYGPDDEFSLQTRIRWNDWEAADQDYQVCFFRVNGDSVVQVAASSDTQDGGVGQEPIDLLSYDPVVRGTYGVGVYRVRVEGVHELELFTPRLPRAGLEGSVAAGSLCDPADSQYAIATGASGHGQGPYDYEVFAFSSKGPTSGPGGTLSGGRIAPALTGYSFTSNSRGQYQMSGTSAAAPHVAGAAALVRSARPSWSSLELRLFLEQRAIDIAHTGRDNASGAGRVFLGSPLPPAEQCPATVSTPATVPSEGGAASVSVESAPGCPWFAATPTAWIAVSAGSSGDGDGSVSYTVAANRSDSPRQGALLIAGSRLVVVQEAAEVMPQPRRPSGRVRAP